LEGAGAVDASEAAMSIETTTPFLRGLEERRSRVERFLVAAHELPRMTIDERIELVEDVTAFLADTLLPHADAAQRVLYAEADRQLGHTGAGESLTFDRQEIRTRIAELAACEPRRSGRLQELLYALYVVTSTHVQKEEEAYLRLLDSQPGSMERVMGGMAALDRV
jgi:hypothetical protein